MLSTTQKEGLDSHQINKKQPSAGGFLDLQLLRKYNREADKHQGAQSLSVRRVGGQACRAKEKPSLPCFQADQGVLDSLLIKLGHVLVHISMAFYKVYNQEWNFWVTQDMHILNSYLEHF